MPTNCPEGLSVDIMDVDGSTSLGNVLTCEHIGLTLVAYVIDNSNGNNCTGSVVVSDYLAPQLSCEDIFVFCNQDTHPDSIGYPAVYDNCTDLDSTDLTYYDTPMDLPCFSAEMNESISGKIERLWSVTDEQGHQTTCLQTIYQKNITLGDVVFPKNRDGIEAPKLICNVDDYEDFSVAGYPSVGGITMDNNAICELLVSKTDQVFATCGGATKVIREWRVLNYCSGNFVEDLQIIDIADLEAPVIDCPVDMTVGTNQYDCFAEVILPTATATDNCSDFTISPTWSEGYGYGPFDEVEVGTYTITYTATDECNNSSTCTFLLTVEDDDPPIPICNTTLSISLLPEGTSRIFPNILDEGSFDNCEIAYYKIRRDDDEYGDYVDFSCEDIEGGPVIIDMKIYDTNGLSNQCEIAITVTDNIPPDIICPPDKTINCFEDFEDLTVTGQASAFDNCTVNLLSHTDIVNLNDCGIGTVERTFYTEDSFGNSDSCTQTITIVDNSNPVVQFPEDITIDICDGTIDPSFTGDVFILDEGCRDFTINKTDQIFTGGTVCPAVSRHWTVIDWCVYVPNSGSNNGRYEYEQLIMMTSNQVPEISIEANQIFTDTSSDCSGMNLVLDPAIQINCEAIATITNDSPYADSNEADASGFYPQGTHLITYTTTDICGNIGTSTSEIIVLDGCSSTTASLAGNISNEMGEAVEHVTLELSDGTTRSMVTDATGHYEFTDLPIGMDYNITPTKNLDTENGVSTYDIVLIQKHILGIDYLDSPYKILAADVNNSGTVTTFDIIQIRRVILNLINDFTDVNSWRFIEADFEFTDLLNPFNDPFPEFHQCNSLMQDELDIDFVAFKMGDVNNNADPNSLSGDSEERNGRKEAIFEAEDQMLYRGYEYEIPIRMSAMEEIIGFQFALQFDIERIEFLDLETHDLDRLGEHSFGFNQLNEGVITSSWDHPLGVSTKKDLEIFTLKFRVIEDIQLSEVLEMSNRYLQSELYQEKEKNQIELFDLDLKFIDNIESQKIELYQNYPNPFGENTTIDFQLKECANVQLMIFDSKGNLIQSINKDCTNGLNSITINRVDLNRHSGVLFYQLILPNSKSKIKKMILVDL